MIAAIYARYSSDNQRPQSIADQVNACLRYAMQNSIVVSHELIFTDEAVSGTKSDRIGVTHLLDAAQNKLMDVVLIDDLSRLTRSNSFLHKTIDDLHFSGVNVISVAENIDTSNDGSRLLVSFKGMMNEEFLVGLSQKTLRGQLGQKERGFFIAESAFGYRSIASGESKMDKQGRSRPEGYLVEIHPVESLIVKRIFDEFANGKSLTSITRGLNNDNITSKKKTEKGWSASTVHRILHNEKYIGLWSWGKTQTKRNFSTGKTKQIVRKDGPLFTSNHEDLAIIPKETWDKVQKRFQDTKGVWPGGKKRKGYEGQQGSSVKVYPHELFSGSMVCGICGGSICKVSGKGGTGYYGCIKARIGGCENKVLFFKKSFRKKVYVQIIRIA